MKQLLPLGLVMLLCGCQTPATQTAPTAADTLAYADSLHRALFTLDTHLDTPIQMMAANFDLGEAHDHDATGSQVDLPRMRAGGLDAGFFAVYLGQGARTPAGNEQAKNEALAIFDTIHRAAERHADAAGLALSPADGYRLARQGKVAMFIGMENGWPVGNDLTLLRRYYDLGARYITLTHTKNNDIGDSSTDSLEWGGLSPFGETVVDEMNRLGMMVDISHVSDSTFWDVMARTRAPIIASHSSAWAIRQHPRNLKDDMLRALAKNGGVVQVNLLSDYVKEMPRNPARDSAMAALRARWGDFSALSDADKQAARTAFLAARREYPAPLATVADAADHIDHIVRVAGMDHVGVGADLDGGGGLADLPDVSAYPALTRELVRRGYSADDLEKLWGGNLMRVFGRVTAASEVGAAAP